MAIAHRGAGALAASSTSGATITFALPTGWAANDVCYLIVWGSSAGDNDLTNPTGWTRIGSLFNEIGTNDGELFLWRRVLQSGDSAPQIVVPAAYSGNSLGIFGFTYAVSGADTTTPEDATTVFSQSDAVQDWTPTGITTATANAWVISVAASDDDNTLGMVAGSEQGFTDRASGASYQSTVGGDTAFGLATKEIASAGAVTCPTWRQTVLGNDQWIGVTIAVKPAAGGGGSVTGAAALTASATIAAAPAMSLVGAAGLTGQATLAAAPALALLSAASLSAVASLGGVPALALPGAAALSGTAALGASAQMQLAGAAAITGQATLAGTPAVSLAGAAGLNAEAALGAAAKVDYSGAVALTAVATLAAVGSLNSDGPTGPPPKGSLTLLKVGR